MRLLEASHTVEILREAGPEGLHVDIISEQNGVESCKLGSGVFFLVLFICSNYFIIAHILRLLATHHILRERAPNIFTLNRISSLIDSGKSVKQLKRWESEGRFVSDLFLLSGHFARMVTFTPCSLRHFIYLICVFLYSTNRCCKSLLRLLIMITPIDLR